jgi:hypothetical protein
MGTAKSVRGQGTTGHPRASQRDKVGPLLFRVTPVRARRPLMRIDHGGVSRVTSKALKAMEISGTNASPLADTNSQAAIAPVM